MPVMQRFIMQIASTMQMQFYIRLWRTIYKLTNWLQPFKAQW
jgi:hypothetical protein